MIDRTDVFVVANFLHSHFGGREILFVSSLEQCRRREERVRRPSRSLSSALEQFGKSDARVLTTTSDSLSRYSIRVRCCSCLPLVACELLVPLSMLLTIVYLCQYVLGNSEQVNVTDLHASAGKEKCSLNLLSDLSRVSDEKDRWTSVGRCLEFDQQVLERRSTRLNLFVRRSNESGPKDLLEDFIHRLETQLRINPLRGELTRLPHEPFDVQSILFKHNVDDDTQLNVIIDIHQFTSQVFRYDLLVPMTDLTAFRDKMRLRVDRSFIRRHEHPSEQTVFVSLCSSFSRIRCCSRTCSLVRSLRWAT